MLVLLSYNVAIYGAILHQLSCVLMIVYNSLYYTAQVYTR